MLKYLHNTGENGQILILSVIVLLLLTVNTVVLISGSLRLNQSTRYSVEDITAISLAEAGVDKAVVSLNSTGGAYNGESETSLGNGSFSVTITDKNASTKLVKSTGYFPNKSAPKATRVIQIEIAKGIGAAFNYGLQVGEGGLEMLNNAKVNGSVYSNGNVIMHNGARIYGDAYVAGGVEANADQESDCTSPTCADFIFGKVILGNNQIDVAQSFRPSEDSVINKVALKIKKFGSPSNITVRLLGDDNGQPNKADVLTFGTLSTNLVTSQYGFVEVFFNNSPALLASNTYWILLDTSADQNNYWAWSMDTIKGYTSGSASWTNNWQANSAVWTEVLGDLGFKTYMGGVPTSITGEPNVEIQGDVHANTLIDLKIGGGAYYQLASNINAASYHPNSPDPQSQVFPLSEANITELKQQSENAGINTGNITTCPATLPSGKYIGSINLPNGCTVTVGSPIWVTGDFILSNNNRIRLDAGYGGSSGIIIVDNFINMDTGNIIQGSGVQGSYLLLLSNFNSKDDTLSRDAIEVKNSGNSGILYAHLGSINIKNINTMTELTGWKLILSNNVIVNYDQGLAGAFFNSGPSGSFSVIKGTYQSK